MVRIRFRRVGAKHQASYRIVAADRESPRDGRFLEVLGYYNPRTDPATVRVDEGRLFHWMKNGARPSDAVQTTLTSGGTWARWERYRQGETLDALLAEADQARQEANPRTRRDDLAGSRRRKRRRAAEGAEAAPAAGPVAQAQPAQAAQPAAPAAKAEPEVAAEASAAAPEPEVEVEAPAAEAAAVEPEVAAEAPAAEDGAEAEAVEPEADAAPEAPGESAEPADAPEAAADEDAAS